MPPEFGATWYQPQVPLHRLAIVQKLSRIKRQRSQLGKRRPRQAAREMVTGESHYVWGVRLRVKVVERAGRPHVETDGGRLILYVLPEFDAVKRRELLDRWHRTQLRQKSPN